ncbi:MAG: hypothetical protein H0Z35_02680 [Thermoanaerobacteraceae bacterium]|nr:hypothetical protein [Thermoanaerobacteraceae bacterium]
MKNELNESMEALRLIWSRPAGGIYFLDGLWEKLGIKDVLQKLLMNRKFGTLVERTIFAMVANRALNPKNKLAVEYWVKTKDRTFRKQ